MECELLRQKLNTGDEDSAENLEQESDQFLPEDFTGSTRQVLTLQRIKPNFFRRAVLSSYKGRCCMSGISDDRLLVASHIVPWIKDKANRLNPSNGLCLSAIHDRAFDKGLISLTDDCRVLLSEAFKSSSDDFVKMNFHPLMNKAIDMPERFNPNHSFLHYHRTHVLLK